jgi:hypothetical protein
MESVSDDLVGVTGSDFTGPERRSDSMRTESEQHIGLAGLIADPNGQVSDSKHPPRVRA